jgi:hypothetical protein
MNCNMTVKKQPNKTCLDNPNSVPPAAKHQLPETLKEVSLKFSVDKLSRMGIEGREAIQIPFPGEKAKETENVECAVYSCFAL